MSDTQAEKTTAPRAKSTCDFDIVWMCSEDPEFRLGLHFPHRYTKVSIRGVDEPFRETIASIAKRVFKRSQYNDEPPGLLCTGDVGTGKTSIMRLLHAFILYGLPLDSKDCMWLSHFELTKQLREHHSGEFAGRNRRPRCYFCHYLFIDDLGRGYEDQSGWNLALLDEFFDERWANNLTTFVSTNKTAKELREWPGWSRIVDRLGDPAWMKVINLGSGSRRK